MVINAEIFDQGHVILFNWGVDDDWPVEFVSNNVLNILGYEPDEFISGKVTYSSLIHPLDKAKVLSTVKERVNSGSDYFNIPSYRVLTKNGSVKWVDEFTFIKRDYLGNPTEYWGYIIDITEMKKAENELVRAYENLSPMIKAKTKDLQRQLDFEQKLIDSISNPIFTKGEDLRYISYNTAFCDFFGVGRREVVGKTFADVYEEISRVEDVNYQDKLLFEKGGVRSCNYEVLNRKKEKCNVILDKTVCTLSDNRKIMVGIIVDVTKLKEMEKEISHLQKMEAIGLLAEGIAHEINTPIQYIGDNLRFIEDGMNDLFDAYKKLLRVIKKHKVKIDDDLIDEEEISYLMDDMPEAVGQAVSGVESVSSIVDAMKIFAHPGSKEKDKVDINSIVDTAITISRNEWKYVADLSTRLSPHLPVISGLNNDLLQVMLNLIINAIHAVEEKFSPTKSKGKILISSCVNDDCVDVEIWDNGIGIKEEHKHEIFNPFFTTKKVGTGSGQGLPICYDIIVKGHAGKITFDSDAEKGTSFVVSIPIEEKVK
jgi:PAS domain S-box-containing protein